MLIPTNRFPTSPDLWCVHLKVYNAAFLCSKSRRKTSVSVSSNALFETLGYYAQKSPNIVNIFDIHSTMRMSPKYMSTFKPVSKSQIKRY